MQKSFEFLNEQLTGLRSTVSQGLIETIKVRSYGQQTPIQKLSLVHETKTGIVITPFDPSIISDIMTAIKSCGFEPYLMTKRSLAINLGSNVAEDREKVSRQVSRLTEEAKVSVRNIRRDIKRDIDHLPEDQRRVMLRKLDALTEEFIKKME